MLRRFLGGLALALGSSAALAASADCISDCVDAYQKAMAACEQQFGGPDQTDQLQDCEDDAQAQMGTCNDDCEQLD
jgi:hypothetical protein